MYENVFMRLLAYVLTIKGNPKASGIATIGKRVQMNCKFAYIICAMR